MVQCLVRFPVSAWLCNNSMQVDGTHRPSVPRASVTSNVDQAGLLEDAGRIQRVYLGTWCKVHCNASNVVL